MCFHQLGRDHEAVLVTDEAVTHLRVEPETEDDPSTQTRVARLSLALYNLSIYLDVLGQSKEAGEARRESFHLCPDQKANSWFSRLAHKASSVFSGLRISPTGTAASSSSTRRPLLPPLPSSSSGRKALDVVVGSTAKTKTTTTPTPAVSVIDRDAKVSQKSETEKK